MALPFSGALFITLALHLAFAADGKRACVHLFDLRFDVLAGMDFNVAPGRGEKAAPRRLLFFVPGAPLPPFSRRERGGKGAEREREKVIEGEIFRRLK